MDDEAPMNRLCCPHCGSPAIFPADIYPDDLRECRDCGQSFKLRQGLREDTFMAPNPPAGMGATSFD